MAAKARRGSSIWMRDLAQVGDGGASVALLQLRFLIGVDHRDVSQDGILERARRVDDDFAVAQDVAPDQVRKMPYGDGHGGILSSGARSQESRRLIPDSWLKRPVFRAIRLPVLPRDSVS